MLSAQYPVVHGVTHCMYVLLYHADEGSALHGIRNCTANRGDLYM